MTNTRSERRTALMLLGVAVALVPSSESAAERLRDRLSAERVHSFVRIVLAGSTAATPPGIVLPSEMRAVVAEGPSAVPELLSLLSDQPQIAVAAWECLRQVTHRQFGSAAIFGDASAESEVPRLAAIQEWKQWWEGNKAQSRTQWFVDDLGGDDLALKRWAVLELGRMGDTTAVTPLRRLLSDPAMAQPAARALGELRDPSAIPALIELHLSADTLGVRREGITLLEALTGQTLGYRADGSEGDRVAATERWRRWWNQNRSRLES